jgi:hypothetical protein
MFCKKKKKNGEKKVHGWGFENWEIWMQKRGFTGVFGEIFWRIRIGWW